MGLLWLFVFLFVVVVVVCLLLFLSISHTCMWFAIDPTSAHTAPTMHYFENIFIKVAHTFFDCSAHHSKYPFESLVGPPHSLAHAAKAIEEALSYKYIRTAFATSLSL